MLADHLSRTKGLRFSAIHLLWQPRTIRAVRRASWSRSCNHNDVPSRESRSVGAITASIWSLRRVVASRSSHRATDHSPVDEAVDREHEHAEGKLDVAGEVHRIEYGHDVPLDESAYVAGRRKEAARVVALNAPEGESRLAPEG